MKNNGEYLSDLHFEHQLWNSKLNFYADEVKIYENRLSEIAGRYTSEEVLAQVEHFQNQFIRQKELIDELKHNVNNHEEALVDYAEANPVAVDHAKFRDHGTMREEMEGFDKVYGELKAEFQRFSAKWM